MRYLAVLLILCVALPGYAQQINYQGKVYEPMPLPELAAASFAPAIDFAPVGIQYKLKGGVETEVVPSTNLPIDNAAASHVMPPNEVITLPGAGIDSLAEIFSSLSPVADPETYPASTSVKVFMSFNGTNYVCSGNMISPHFVLTAGHCVYSHSEGGWADELTVVPAYENGSAPFGDADAVSLVSNTGWTQEASFDHDLAIVELDRPVGGLTGSLGYGYNHNNSFYVGQNMNTLGYPAEFPYTGQTMQFMNGTFDEIYTYIFRHYNESYGGSSGSNTYTDGLISHAVLTHGAIDGSYTGHTRMRDYMFDIIQQDIDESTPNTKDYAALGMEANNTTIEAGSFVPSLRFGALNLSSATFTDNVGVDYFIQPIGGGPLELLYSTTYNNLSYTPFQTRFLNTSNVQIPVGTPGGFYYLYANITNADANSGNNLTGNQDRLFIQVTVPPPPVNDVCWEATFISCGETYFGSTEAATNADAPPACQTLPSNNNGVWYTFIGNGGQTTASLCNSDFDTQIEIFTGICGNLNCLIGTDDGGGCFNTTRSRVTFGTVQGETYYIYIKGYGENQGDYVLELTCEDPCPEYEPLACGLTFFHSNEGFEDNFQEGHYAGCEPVLPAGILGGPERIYEIDHPGGRFTVSVLNDGVDLDLFVFDEAPCVAEPGSVTALDGCLYSSITAPLQNGLSIDVINEAEVVPGLYYVVVDGAAQNDSGVDDYEITYDCTETIGFIDELVCDDAIFTSTIGSTNNISAYFGAQGNAPGTGYTGPEHVYAFEVAEGGQYTFTATPNSPGFNLGIFLTQLIFPCPGFVCSEVPVASSTGYSTGQSRQIVVTLNPGSYRLYVDGFFSSMGNYTLAVNCPADCPGPPVYQSCPDVAYVQLSNGNFQFTSPNADPEFAWQINQVDAQNTAFFQQSIADGIECNFGNTSDQFEICYPYLDFDGCLAYCCRTICVSPNPPGEIYYAYDEDDDIFHLSLSGVSAQTGSQQWYYLNGITEIMAGEGPTIDVDLGGICFNRTYYCRYFDPVSGCYRVISRTIEFCNPFTCFNIDFGPLADQSGYLLELSGQSGQVTWQDDQTGTILSGDGLSLTLVYDDLGCRYREISARYYDLPAETWRICCIRFWFCDPYECGNLTALATSDGDGFELTLSAPNGIEQVSWQDDDMGSLIPGNGTTIFIPFDDLGCRIRNISVRYYDPLTSCWKICCISFEFCPPCPLPTPSFEYELNQNMLTVLNQSPPGDAYQWSFGGVAVSNAFQPEPVVLPPGEHIICLTVTNDCGSEQHCVEIYVPDFANDLTFYCDTAICATAGELIVLPLRVRNFNNVNTFQMTVELSDGQAATITDAQFQLGTGSGLAAVINDSTATVNWFHTNTLSLPDEEMVVLLSILAGPDFGEDGTSVDVMINGNVTPLFAEVDFAPVVNIIALPGSLVACSEIELAGRIYREDDTGIGSVDVMLLQGNSLLEMTATDAAGNYAFSSVPTGQDYRIVPRKNTDVRNGVNGGDLSRIARHIVQIEPLDGPYKRIAADVKDIAQINGGDLSDIASLIVFNTDEFSDALSWHFVDAQFNFPDPGQPTSQPYSAAIELQSVQSGQSSLDFIGVKMGDVNNSGNPGAPSPQADFSADSLTFTFSENAAVQQQTYTVDVLAADFQAMLAAQFTVGWSAETLEFIGVSNLHPDLELSAQNFNFNNSDIGRLPLVWFSALPVSLADTAHLFSIDFNVIGAVEDTLGLAFLAQPTPYYFEDENGEINAQFVHSPQTVAMASSTREVGEIDSWQIYPNPTNGRLTVRSMGSESGFGLELIDVTGRRLQNWNSEGRQLTVDLSTFAAGAYFLKITDRDSSILRKISLLR